jgi:Putative zinc-finger
MNCLEDGLIQARLDGELSESELKMVEAHLAACAECRARAQNLEARSAQVRGALASLEPEEAPADARVALARFRAEHGGEPLAPSSWLARAFARRWRPAWAAAGFVGLLVACFSFAPARSWAQRILAMLRVQKIAVVQVDPQSFPGLATNRQMGEKLGRFLSDNIVVTMDPGKPQPVASAELAAQRAGFPVRLPSIISSAPALSVSGELAFQMTVNRDRLQGLLEDLGRPDLNLPASLDGALIAVHVPKGVVAQFGDCSLRGHRGALTPQQMTQLAGCVSLVQIPSPTVSVPPDLNIAQLAQLGLEFAGMSPQDAQAFCQTVDWTSTLVIPLPVRDATYMTVPVDGVEGTLISVPQMGNWRAPTYNLLWVKNGILYALMGYGDSGQAEPLADSLQ